MVDDLIESMGFEGRTLQRSHYPHEFPLKEVQSIARACAGGVVLGFEQTRVTAGITKPDTADERGIDEPIALPTPWNHLEAGILFGLGLPLLIFREAGVSGGIFDDGVTDVFVQRMPDGTAERWAEIRAATVSWQNEVLSHRVEAGFR